MTRLWRIELVAGLEQPCTSIGWYDARSAFGALLVGFIPTFRQLRSVSRRPLCGVTVSREVF